MTSSIVNYVRNSYRSDSTGCKNIDLLQDFLQGRLLLGSRSVNARTNSEYNYGFRPCLCYMADSKGTTPAQTAAGKAASMNHG